MSWFEVAKRVACWTIPVGFYELLRKWLRGKVGISPEEQALLERNRARHKRHAGERCFILATGPSIKNQDLKLLRGEVCIAVSNFFVHPDYHVIRPRYYCIAPYHLPITEEAWKSWMEALDASVGDATLFFSLSDRLRNNAGGLFAGKRVYYLKFGGQWEIHMAQGIDITKPLPGPSSVTIMALYIALYMGFRHIYLLGCDHDWILHLNSSTHFYEESQHELSRAGYNEWFKEDLESYCRGYIKLSQQYKVLSRVAKAKSIHIFNASAGGLLDVFPRVRYESLFVKGNKEHIGC